MANSKYSATSIVVPSFFVIHLVNGAQFLNGTYVAWYILIVTLSRTKMKALLLSQRLDFKTSASV